MGKVKVLSDPNRLAMLSLLSMKEMTMSRLSKMLDLSVQNTQYHIKKLLESELIRQTKSEVVGNLVEKYHRSTFESGIISEAADDATVDISERVELVLAAMGAIKGVVSRGIMVLDGSRTTSCVRRRGFATRSAPTTSYYRTPWNR